LPCFACNHSGNFTLFSLNYKGKIEKYIGGEIIDFFLQGYNNWTHGLYGYSWDMMVHSWNTILILPRVVDNHSGQEMFLDAEV